MADYIGQRLGNYELLGLLGQGGFAEVYLARHIYLKTAAAIKVLQVRLTDSALDKFLASDGWTVGADASVTLVNVGANASVDTKTAQQAVIGYVLTNGGLMANVSLEGTKITPLTI